MLLEDIRIYTIAEEENSVTNTPESYCWEPGGIDVTFVGAYHGITIDGKRCTSLYTYGGEYLIINVPPKKFSQYWRMGNADLTQNQN